MIKRVKKRTNFVEVKRKCSGDGAVKPGFEERRPRITKNTTTAEVALTHARNPRMHHLQATIIWKLLIAKSHYPTLFDSEHTQLNAFRLHSLKFASISYSLDLEWL